MTIAPTRVEASNALHSDAEALIREAKRRRRRRWLFVCAIGGAAIGSLIATFGTSNSPRSVTPPPRTAVPPGGLSAGGRSSVRSFIRLAIAGMAKTFVATYATDGGTIDGGGRATLTVAHAGLGASQHPRVGAWMYLQVHRPPGRYPLPDEKFIWKNGTTAICLRSSAGASVPWACTAVSDGWQVMSIGWESNALGYLPLTLEQDIDQFLSNSNGVGRETANVTHRSSPSYGRVTCLSINAPRGVQSWCLDSAGIFVSAANQFWWNSVRLVHLSRQTNPSTFAPIVPPHGAWRLGPSW